jgi:hypothetical protein
MADFDFKQVLADSIALAKNELGNTFKKVKPFAEHEFTQFSENALFLASLKLKGTIDEEELKSRILLQKLALANVLLAIQGVGLVTAQNVVNGVLGIVVKAVETAIGVAIPV